MGLSQDLSAVDFGTRTKRYALIIDDLKVQYVEVSSIRHRLSHMEGVLIILCPIG